VENHADGLPDIARRSTKFQRLINKSAHLRQNESGREPESG